MPMLRPTLLALLLMAGQQARAADPAVITLSCNGKITDSEPKPVEKMGVVANLKERTVSFMGFIAPISTVDAACSVDPRGGSEGVSARPQRILRTWGGGFLGSLHAVRLHMAPGHVRHRIRRPMNVAHGFSATG